MKKYIIVLLILILLLTQYITTYATVDDVNVVFYSLSPHAGAYDNYDVWTFNFKYKIYGANVNEIAENAQVHIKINNLSPNDANVEYHGRYYEDGDIQAPKPYIIYELEFNLVPPVGVFTLNINITYEGISKLRVDRSFKRGEHIDEDMDGLDDDTGEIVENNDYPELPTLNRMSNNEDMNNAFRLFRKTDLKPQTLSLINNGNAYYLKCLEHEGTYKIVLWVAGFNQYELMTNGNSNIIEVYDPETGEDGIILDTEYNVYEYIDGSWVFTQEQIGTGTTNKMTIDNSITNVLINYHNFPKYIIAYNRTLWRNSQPRESAWENSNLSPIREWEIFAINNIDPFIDIKYVSPRDGFAQNIWAFIISWEAHIYNIPLSELSSNHLKYQILINGSYSTGALEVEENKYQVEDGYIKHNMRIFVELPLGVNDITIVYYRGTTALSQYKFTIHRLAGFVDTDNDGFDDRTGFPDDGSQDKPDDYRPPYQDRDYTSDSLITGGFEFIKEILDLFPPEVMSIFVIAVTTIIALAVKRMIL